MILYNLRGCVVGIIIKSKLHFRKIGLIIGVVLGSFFAFSYISQPVNAEVTTVGWSWVNSQPTVVEAEPVDDLAGRYCPGTYQTTSVATVPMPRWACIERSEHLKFGSYFDGHRYPPIVGFAYDSEMYLMKGTGCQEYGTCVYIPEADVLVIKQAMAGGIGRSLVVYKNFTKRLTKITDTLQITTGYQFDSSNPDYVFQNEAGYTWPVEAISASANGKWLAVEYRERGIGLLNIETFDTKRISTLAFGYGVGRDPVVELAVSNDGRHIALTGTNVSSIMVYSVTGECGDTPTDARMQSITPITTPCKALTVNTSTFIDQFYSATNPRFELDGAELNFFAKSYNGSSRAVSLHAGQFVAQRLDYLALGDSFTSGEGETSDKYYQEGTNDKFEKCHLSTRSYPYLIATSLGINPQKARSVACSGATMDDVVGEDVGYWGQGGRLKTNGLNLNEVTKTIYQESARDSFNPGRIHQIAFVKRYKPKVITVGIGGNDVGFMDKLRACVGLDTCEWANTAEGREKTAFEVRAAFNTLSSTYSALQNASPQSRIYAVGYPKVIDSDGECSLIEGILLNTTERNFMNEGIKYINQVIAAAAEKSGVKYMDIQDSLGDKVLCGDDKPSSMNGIRPGDDITVSEKLNWLKVVGNESFHPRPTAHAAITSAILQNIPNVLSYDHCQIEFSQSNGTCQIHNTEAPWPSDYWLEDGVEHNYAAQRLANFVDNPDSAPDERQKTIVVEQFTLDPGSPVRIEIHSDPVTLATTTADASGGLSLDIELPSDLPEGFHTIHLYGTSYSGSQVDLYQVIKYELPPSDTPSPITTAVRVPNDTQPKQPQTNNSVSVAPSSPSDTSQTTVGDTTNDDAPAVLGTVDTGVDNLPTPSAPSSITTLAQTPNTIQHSPANNITYWLLAGGILLLFTVAFVVYRVSRRSS